MTSSKSVEQRMAAAANKARRDQDALQALRDYAAEKARIDANTLRLRALRLEKEAADAQAAADDAGRGGSLGGIRAGRGRPARSRRRSSASVQPLLGDAEA